MDAGSAEAVAERRATLRRAIASLTYEIRSRDEWLRRTEGVADPKVLLEREAITDQIVDYQNDLATLESELADLAVLEAEAGNPLQDPGG